MLTRLRKWISGLKLDVVVFDTYDRYDDGEIVVHGESSQHLWKRKKGDRFIIDANGEFVEVVITNVEYKGYDLRWTAESARTVEERNQLRR